MNKVSMKPTAYAKMRKLVRSCNGEVGMLMLVERKQEDEDWLFNIYDILEYPQYVSGGRVITDDAEYSEFMNSLDDDVFNSIRGQCHSHVNMGVFASGTDLSDQLKTRLQLSPDDFYVHLITNKRDEMHWFIWNNQVVDEKPEFELDVDVDLNAVKPMKDLPRVDYSKYIIEERTSGLVEEDDEFDSLVDDDGDYPNAHYRDDVDDIDAFLQRYRAEKIEEAKKYQGPDWLRNWFKSFKD